MVIGGKTALPKSREVIYLNADLKQNCVTSYGIEFKEFANNLLQPLSNLLILAGHYAGKDFDYTTGCDYVRHENLLDILEKDVYRYGDFCWVDFDSVDKLEQLEPKEVAELLYLGQLFKPVNSPFFYKLNNRFAYLAHDDGWFNRFYCQNLSEFAQMLGNIVPTKIKGKLKSREKKKLIPSLPEDITMTLLQMAEDGVLIDFDNVIKYPNYLEVIFYVIGKFLGTDEMYRNLERHIRKAKCSPSLVLKNKEWSIIDYSK